jgi:acetyltransferase-like isoleucine patch superfamily enzyme
MPSLIVTVGRLRRLERLVRGRAWAAYPEVTVGARVQVGRGCRLIVEPGSRVSLGDGCEIDDGTTIAAYGAEITIGDACFVGHHCTLAARRSVTIGAGAFLGELVSVRDHDHDPAMAPADGVMLTTPVTIGAGAWLGCKVTVLRGATIGDRSVIGANAVVKGDIPPGSTAVGIPARVVQR